MNIFSSNKLDVLYKHLNERMGQSGKPLFQKDVVVMQSHGMAKWLNLELAKENGISAQLDCPFIKGFIVQILQACDLLGENHLWDREVLTWRIYKNLPILEERCAAAQAIKDYVKGDPLRRYQLATQLSSLYDEYMIFRPDWIDNWSKCRDAKFLEKEGHQAWQKELWKLLLDESKASEDKQAADEVKLPFHEALSTFIDTRRKVDLSKLDLPPLISIFGVTNMPPRFINFFKSLSERLGTQYEVNLYYLNPSKYYWGDLTSGRQLMQRSSQQDIPELAHSLLKSWGLLGRDYLNQLVELVDFDFDCELEYISSDQTSSLGQIQNGILELEDSFHPALKDDGSIVVNSCHNPLRELEVLHDYLRRILSEDESLEARDIMVLCPDMTAYQPYIKSVFDNEDFLPLGVSLAILSLRFLIR